MQLNGITLMKITVCHGKSQKMKFCSKYDQQLLNILTILHVITISQPYKDVFKDVLFYFFL